MFVLEEKETKMASQPANSTISVNRRLRAVFNNGRHTSIKHLTTPFDSPVVVVAGNEILVSETRDTTFRSDAFRWGHPVVVFPKGEFTLTEALDSVDILDFPVRLPGNPREIQIQTTAANVAADLYGDIRDAAPETANPTQE